MALYWAHSPSAQKRVPLFLESKPRGGDWSGLFFDARFSSDLSPVMDLSPSLDMNGRRDLANSKCGLLSPKQIYPKAFFPKFLQSLFYKHQVPIMCQSPAVQQRPSEALLCLSKLPVAKTVAPLHNSKHS